MALRAPALVSSLPHVDRRYVIGGLLAAAAAVLVLVVTQPPERSPVLVAESDLPSGVPLSELDVGVRYVEDTSGLVEGDGLGELASWSLQLPLAADEPIVASALRPPAMVDRPDTMALSLPAAQAVLGRLGPGDRVDIYVSTDPGSGDASPGARLLAADVYIVDAAMSEDAATRGHVDVLVAVDDELAPRLAAALRRDTVDLVRVGP